MRFSSLLAIKHRAGSAFEVPAVNHFGRILAGMPGIGYKHTNKGNFFYVLPSL